MVLLKSLRGVISPTLQNISMSQRARLLQRTIIALILMVTLIGTGFYLRSTIPAITAVITILADAALLGALAALRSGRLRLAGLLFALTTWATTTYIMANLYSTSSNPLLGMYVVITVLCALTLGGMAGYLYGGLSLVTIVGILLLEGRGLLAPLVELTPSVKFTWHLVIFASASILVHTTIRAIDQLLRESSERADQLALKNRELEGIRRDLEGRVAERTHDILREKRFFEALFHNSPVAIVLLDLKGRVNAVNPAFERLFGYAQAEITGQNLDLLVADPQNPDEPFHNTWRTLQGEIITQQGRRRRKDGSLIWVEVLGAPIMDGEAQAGLLAIYYDMTAQRRAQEKLETSEREYRTLFENVLDGVYRSTPDGRFLTANPALIRMLGYDSLEELLAVDIRKDVYVNPADRDALLERQRREEVLRNVELLLKRKDGKHIVVLESSFVVRSPDGEVLYYEGTLTDITERKQAEEQLLFLATHDSLTGLPNRISFFEQLNQLIQQRGDGRKIAVLFLDLDGFKEVNDRFGHAHGDALLRRVAQLLQSTLRPGDLVARLSGDEFAFYFDNVDGPEHAAILAAKVQGILATPVQVMEVEVRITSSIGISLYPTDGCDAETLLKRADAAMYHAKEGGKNNYTLYYTLCG